jgi:MFS superfamily sulfate permease-like transporter
MSDNQTLHLEPGWKANLKHDLPAGLVVYLVALPLCLGIALASGAPLFAGIIAGVVGGIVVGALSGSEVSVSGPAAGLAVIVADGITSLGAFEIFLVAVVVAGLIQIVLGVLRAGVVGDWVPNSVIKGMLAGIGIVIFLKQIPHALGRDADFEGDLAFSQFFDGKNTFTEIVAAFMSASWEAVVITGVGLIILIAWQSPAIKDRAWASYLPGPLVAVLLGVALNQLFLATGVGYLSAAEGHLVELPTMAGSGGLGGLLVFPDFSAIASPEVLTLALTLAAVGSIETLLSVEATDRLDPFKRISNTNRELVAQGIGNSVSGLLGGIPVTSVIIRSSTNIYSGGRTRMSPVFHGVLLGSTVLLVPGLLNMIPLASLAAILLVIGYKLASVSVFKAMWASGTSQFVPFIVTVSLIVVTDLLTGIAAGIVVGLYFVIRGNYHQALVTVSEGDQHLVRFNKDMAFVHKIQLKRHLRGIPNGATVHIDGTKSMLIDRDIWEIIDDFHKTAPFRDITVTLKNVAERTVTNNRPSHAA